MRSQVYRAMLVAFYLTAAGASAHETPHHVIVKPDEIIWMDVPALPGAKIGIIEGPLDQASPFTFRLKLPANYDIPAHIHPVIERCTVLSGTFYMGSGSKFDKTKGDAIPAGGIAIIPAKTAHFAWTKEETIVQLNGTGPWGITFVDPYYDPKQAIK